MELIQMPNTKKIDSLADFERIFGTDLEGIIINESPLNHYDIIKYNKMNTFPYYLIGKIQSKFHINNQKAYIQGVGMLIGPRVILTVAHNLCYYQNSRVYLSYKVNFFPSSNCDFNLFHNLKSSDCYIPPEYINGLLTNNKDEQLLNDWGLVYLSQSIGEEVSKVFNSEKTEDMLKIEGEFFSIFLEDHETISKNEIQNGQISIVGYTQFKESYQYTSSYKFRNCFEKCLINEYKDEEIDYSNISMQINSFESNQGKIIFEYIREAKEEKRRLMHCKNHKHTNNHNGLYIEQILLNDTGMESLMINCLGYHNESDEEMMQDLELIVFSKEEYNPHFNERDKEKFILSESKGKLKSLSNSKQILHYQISTYKGQSGSPIFIKKANGNIQLIGIHSRRGPSIGELLIENKRRICVNDKQSSLNSSLTTDYDMSSNYQSLNSDQKLNGICEYNIGLGLNRDLQKTIIFIAVNHLRPYHPLQSFHSNRNYININLYMNTKKHFQYLIKHHLSLSTLFDFGSLIFYNLPKEFLLLKDIINDEVPILTYDTDSTKTFAQLYDTPEASYSFEVRLNIRKYVEYSSNTLLQAFQSESEHHITLLEIKNNLKLHKNFLFSKLPDWLSLFKQNEKMYKDLNERIKKTVLLLINIAQDA